MTNKRLMTVAAFAIAALSAGAQELKFNVEYRPRAELRSGYGRPLLDEEEAAFFIIQRSRLGANYIDDRFEIKLTVQDSRLWGETGTNSEATSTSSALTLFEANGTIKFTPNLKAIIGRQTIQLDDGRLFTAGNWTNTGTAHDAAMLKYDDNNGFRLLGALAYNNSSISNSDYGYLGAMKYRYMGLLWSSQKLGSVELSEIFVDEGVPYVKDESEHHMWHHYTFGANAKLNISSEFDILLTAYGQAGRIGDEDENAKLSAFILAAKANYRMSSATRLFAGIEAYSGDDGSHADKIKTFQPLYGGAHAFNGSMDYWTNNLPKAGLLDIYVGANHLLNDKWTIEATLRSLNTLKEYESSYIDGRSLGVEFDAKLQYKMFKGLTAELGYSFYAINDNVRSWKLGSPNADTKFPQFAYLMMTFKPQDFGIKF